MPSIEVVEPDLSPLVARARQLAAAGGRRLLGLAGPPGVGKSTVAEALVAALAPAAVLVPMDGFHLAEAELRRLGRHDRKGAPDTFDAAGFVALLRRLRHPDHPDHAGHREHPGRPEHPGHREHPGGCEREPVYAPRFDRSLEEAIAGAIPVDPDVPLVVTEGNYLLLDQGAWSRVREVLDEVWYLERDEAERLTRLTARHVAYGRPPEVAAARARDVDQRNADLVATTRPRAHLRVRLH